MAAAQLDRDILNCIYFRTVNRVTVTPVILDLKYQIYSGRRCASVGRIYTQEQEQEQDGTIWRKGKNVMQVGQLLEEDISRIFQWTAKWRMKFSIEKTEVCVFSVKPAD